MAPRGARAQGGPSLARDRNGLGVYRLHPPRHRLRAVVALHVGARATGQLTARRVVGEQRDGGVRELGGIGRDRKRWRPVEAQAGRPDRCRQHGAPSRHRMEHLHSHASPHAQRREHQRRPREHRVERLRRSEHLDTVERARAASTLGGANAPASHRRAFGRRSRTRGRMSSAIQHGRVDIGRVTVVAGEHHRVRLFGAGRRRLGSSTPNGAIRTRSANRGSRSATRRASSSVNTTIRSKPLHADRW